MCTAITDCALYIHSTTLKNAYSREELWQRILIGKAGWSLTINRPLIIRDLFQFQYHYYVYHCHFVSCRIRFSKWSTIIKRSTFEDVFVRYCMFLRPQTFEGPSPNLQGLSHWDNSLMRSLLLLVLLLLLLFIIAVIVQHKQKTFNDNIVIYYVTETRLDGQNIERS